MEERRRYLRIPTSVPLKIYSAEDADIITETVNLSSGGAYCRVNKFIPVMTRLKILMFVPNPKESKKRSHKIECEGIVVRTEPEYPSEEIKEYHIAIYFNRLKKPDRARIADYVKKRSKSKPSWN